MVERKPSMPLRREAREGERGDVDAERKQAIEAEILHERAVGVGKLTQGFREVAESDEDG